MRPLLEAHYHEIAHYQDIPLQPDWEFYRRSPIVRVFTARADGVLIGYGVFFISKNKHYMSSLQAVQDILFVSPEYRGRMVGPRLIAFCEECMKEEGVQCIYQHTKRAHNFGPLLGSMGYEEIETIWAKRLDVR
jgi:GNAT superfamily N-acetyltransferase